MKLPRRAIVIPPPDTYARALTREAEPRAVDLALARQQHAAYADALRQMGLQVKELPANADYPDCCFVQDPVIVADGVLIVTRMGAESRRHEGRALVSALAETELPKYSVTRPGTLEGGDVMVTEDDLYVGLSSRTNMHAVNQLRDVFSARRVIPVPVPEKYLHLLTGCSYLGEGCLLATAEIAALPELAGLRRMIVPDDEWPAANVLAVGKEAIILDGYPRTADMLSRAGFQVRPVPLTEFEKRDGSVTCLSLLY